MVINIFAVPVIILIVFNMIEENKIPVKIIKVDEAILRGWTSRNQKKGGIANSFGIAAVGDENGNVGTVYHVDEKTGLQTLIYKK